MKDTLEYSEHNRPHDETVKSDSYVLQWTGFYNYLLLQQSILYLVLLVKLVGGDLQKRLQVGTGSVIHQQVNGADFLQGCLRGPPIR